MSDFYVTTFCNFAHSTKTGRPIGHECYILDPKKLQLEREGRFDEIDDVRRSPLEVVRGRARK